MQKIPSIYLRDYSNPHILTRSRNPRCDWVFDWEGLATIKWDGTCVLLTPSGEWFARHQVRPGKAEPPNYIAVEHDPHTGKTQGWIPMEQSQYRKYWQAAIDHGGLPLDPGTYELCGPKIGSNPHDFLSYVLVRHGGALTGVPDAILQDFDRLSLWLNLANTDQYFEGIVWHHEDGRMAKIKTRDFDQVEPARA